MKKLISLFLVCLLMLSCVTLAHAASEPEEKFPNASYDAVKTASAPKIDGVMDDAYKAAPVVKIDKKIMVDLLYDESEIATGEMRILWDANNLYVFATIHDATWAAPYKDTGWFNNCDSLWFATGANADLTRVNCYAVARAGKAYKNFYEEAGAPAIEFASKNLYKGKEVAMTTYGNAEGSYPANCPKPTGAVDSYVLEIKIPYAGNTAGRKVYFGAFLCDDTDFNEKILTQNIADSFNLVDGRSRTSEAVSTVKDNGIWQVTGNDGSDLDMKEHFDILTLKDKAGTPAATTKAPANKNNNNNNNSNNKPAAKTTAKNTPNANITTVGGDETGETTVPETDMTTDPSETGETTAPDVDTDTDAAPKKSHAGTIILIIAIVVVLGGGGAGAYFLLKAKKM